MHNEDFNYNMAKVQHPLEVPIGKGCPVDEKSGLKHDPRFIRVTGYLDSEYSLLRHNGVLNELMKLPGYS